MIPLWLSLLLVPASLVALLGVLRDYQRRCVPDPELVRKLLHIGIGLVCLTFPWLFTTLTPVLLLLVVCSALLLALRTVPRLRATYGMVLGGVGRASLGDLAFAPGVALTFWLSGGEPLHYCLPLLLLTLADAAAALVGKRYGRLPYATLAGSRTLEGSLAFFGVALLCAQAALLLWSSLPTLAALPLALLLALLLTLVESVAGYGLDNLLVPVAGCGLLHVLVQADPAAHLAALAGAGTLTLLVLLNTALSQGWLPTYPVLDEH
jgi:phytol kinase